MMKWSVPILCIGIVGLAGCSMEQGGSAYKVAEAQAGAAFRLQAREVFERLYPVCSYTQNAQQIARYEALRRRYTAIKEWVSTTPFAIDLASVEADYKHYWSVNRVNCGPTDTEESLAAMNADLDMIKDKLSRLEMLTGGL